MSYTVKSSCSNILLDAKESSAFTFQHIGDAIKRNEVGVAAIFFGQAAASRDDFRTIASMLGMPQEDVLANLVSLEYPNRGQEAEMPPREPLIYRLYEIVQTYGRAYKAVLNEKFGDGIMSAIAFSTTVEKETDKDGAQWAVITMRGKW
ncbi:MAG: Cyanate hydratase [Trizodia sp. TS-e1964]|nr:MAG: Cyanate hydratase [Trizodia sp. TS-e1964]